MIRHWPLTGIAELERMLTGCGYAGVRTVTDGVQMRYPRAEVLAMLDGLRDQSDGSITRTARFGWTVGMAPGRPDDAH